MLVAGFESGQETSLIGGKKVADVPATCSIISTSNKNTLIIDDPNDGSNMSILPKWNIANFSKEAPKYNCISDQNRTTGYDVCYDIPTFAACPGMTCDSDWALFTFNALVVFLILGGLFTPLLCAILPGGPCRALPKGRLRRLCLRGPCRRATISSERLAMERKQNTVFAIVMLSIGIPGLVGTMNDPVLGFSVLLNITGFVSCISYMPCCLSYVEGSDEDRETKTRYKVLYGMTLVFVAFEMTLILICAGVPNSPNFQSLVFLSISMPVLSMLFFVFISSDVRWVQKRNAIQRETSRRNLIQLQEEHDAELNDVQQHVLNPLEQSQFLIESRDLQLQERIGQGGCGFIYKATMGVNTIVAAKEVMSATIDPENLQEFEHEARMLTQMNHPRILRVFGFCTKTAEESKDNQEHRFIVTELAPNGSLEQAIEAAIQIQELIKEIGSGTIKLPFTKVKALEWAIEIASGMNYLHQKGFVHRDIKPQNILLNKSNDALVADLGTVRRPVHDEVRPSQPRQRSDSTKAKRLSRFVRQLSREKNASETVVMTRQSGTILYMAPEQYTEGYSYPVDVWAYGVTLTRLFTLKWPYIEKNVVNLVLGISRGLLFPIEVLESDVPDVEVLKCINQCLEFDPQDRPSFKEIERMLGVALANCRKRSKKTKPNPKKKRDSTKRTTLDMLLQGNKTTGEMKTKVVKKRKTFDGVVSFEVERPTVRNQQRRRSQRKSITKKTTLEILMFGDDTESTTPRSPHVKSKSKSTFM